MLPILLTLLLLGHPRSTASVEPDLLALRHKKRSLDLELRQIETDWNAFYLIIDLSSRIVHLKSGGRLLRTSSVKDFQVQSLLETQLCRMVSRIDPVTPEPGNDGLRLRGRLLPLDFAGRLIEGPRERSVLYFAPAVILQPMGFPAPAHFNSVELDGGDLKALGSAIRPGDVAILIPPADPFR